MKETLYMAWRYLSYHRLKTGILITSITLILFLPVGLRVLVDQSSQQLTARAVATVLPNTVIRMRVPQLDSIKFDTTP